MRNQYRAIGKDPAELIQVEPLDGGWNDAVSYEITQNDQERARIYRRDLDDGARTKRYGLY